jgi:hypothetical protein
MFWRQESMMSQSTELISDALCRGELVEGLSILPVEDFLSRLMSSFSGAVRNTSELNEWIKWISPNDEDSFKVTWSDQHVRVECQHLQLSEVNEIVDIAKSFGCPLYDPQTKERFRLLRE